MKEKKSDRVTVNVSMSLDEKTKLKALAFIEGKTIGSIAAECLRAGIDKRCSRHKEKIEVFMKLSQSFNESEV